MVELPEENKVEKLFKEYLIAIHEFQQKLQQLNPTELMEMQGLIADNLKQQMDRHPEEKQRFFNMIS